MSQNNGLIDNLVTQFSSPLDCFRELAQNSMDAGSPTIEIWSDFIPGEDYIGTIALHVDDWGEGMDEQIIDTYLTQLFSSSKEDDLTKIGKFGIGFVSVFALNPRAVLVQTGRGGEYWEVVFHQDRTFTKTRLNTPVEGTQITLFLSGDQPKYAQLVKDIRARLIFWCEHSETEITFEDRSPAEDEFVDPEVINRPFEIEGQCPVRAEYQGTEIVCAYQARPVYGFYNAGLTLAQTAVADDVLGERAARFRRIGFKIKSRYLEHTLSRETIMRDENYEKAMSLLEAAVEERLFPALIERLESLSALKSWGFSEAQLYAELIEYLHLEGYNRLETIASRSIIRLLHGSSASLNDIFEYWASEGRVLISPDINELSEGLSEADIPIVYGDANPTQSYPLKTINRLLEGYLTRRHQRSFGRRVRGVLGRFFGGEKSARRVEFAAPDEVYLPIVINKDPPEEIQALLSAAAAILERAQTGYARLESCQMALTSAAAPLFVVGSQLSSFMARPPRGVARSTRGLNAAVNLDHPHIAHLLKFAEEQPQLAAYCLAKSLLLSEDRRLDRDVAMLKAAQA